MPDPTDPAALREWAEDEAYDYTLSDGQRALLHRAADAMDQSTQLRTMQAKRDEALAEVGELSDQLHAALNEGAAERHALDNLVDQAVKIAAVKDIADDMEESGFSRLIQFADKLRAAVTS